MLIEIRNQAFDPWQEVSRYQENCGLVPGSYGACATFVGTLRDFNHGDKVKWMRLTHYQGMTEHQLSKIAEQVLSQYRLLDLIIVHRVGDLNPNEPIVLVAAWSVHRRVASKRRGEGKTATQPTKASKSGWFVNVFQEKRGFLEISLGC